MTQLSQVQINENKVADNPLKESKRVDWKSWLYDWWIAIRTFPGRLQLLRPQILLAYSNAKWVEGYQEGQNDGYWKGHAEGHREAWATGYQRGHVAGWNAARAARLLTKAERKQNNPITVDTAKGIYDAAASQKAEAPAQTSPDEPGCS